MFMVLLPAPSMYCVVADLAVVVDDASVGDDKGERVR